MCLHKETVFAISQPDELEEIRGQNKSPAHRFPRETPKLYRFQDRRGYPKPIVSQVPREKAIYPNGLAASHCRIGILSSRLPGKLKGNQLQIRLEFLRKCHAQKF